jgi:hypothetical protein
VGLPQPSQAHATQANSIGKEKQAVLMRLLAATAQGEEYMLLMYNVTAETGCGRSLGMAICPTPSS